MSVKNASCSLFYGGIFTVQRIVKSVDVMRYSNLKSLFFNHLSNIILKKTIILILFCTANISLQAQTKTYAERIAETVMTRYPNSRGVYRGQCLDCLATCG